jgi:WD40 repeat protein
MSPARWSAVLGLALAALAAGAPAQAQAQAQASSDVRPRLRDSPAEVAQHAAGREPRRLGGDRGPCAAHAAAVTALAWSADGRWVASGDADGSVILWDCRDGLRLRRFEAHRGRVGHLAFTPDGDFLLSHGLTFLDPALGEGEGWGTCAVVWKVTTGARVHSVSAPGNCIALAPDGSLLAAADADGGRVLVWPVDGGPSRVLELPGRVTRLQFLPGRRWLLVASENALRVAEPESGSYFVAMRMPRFLAQFPAPLAVGDGRHCVRWGKGGRLELADLIDFFGAEAAEEPLLAGAICVSPDGRLAVVGYSDGTLELQELAAPKTAPRADRPPPDFDLLWSNLASTEAETVYRTHLALVAAGPDAVAALRQRLVQKATPDAAAVAAWIKDLGHSKYAVRAKAQAELAQAGKLVEAELLVELHKQPTLEVRRRVDLLLEKLQGQEIPPAVLRVLRAVTVLELIGTVEARDVLESLAGGGDGVLISGAARRAQGREHR